jgi:hypothetical protein
MNAPATTPREKYNKRLAQLKAPRQRHEPSWAEIRDFIAPDSYEDPASQQTNDGARKDSAIVNNTPTLALLTAVAGLVDGTCSPTERWIELEAADPELQKLHNVQVYCQEATDRLLSELARSNYYKNVPEDFLALLGYGTCASWMAERFTGDALFSFQSQPIGSYYIAQSFEREVNEFARDLRMSADQMVATFGNKVSSSVMEAYKSDRGQQEFPVVHIVHQNADHNPMQDALAADKPWRSCYYETKATDSKEMLEVSGFSVFPVACARWSTVGANPWGYGCGRLAIGDSRALMAMEVDAATAVEMQVRPPMLAPAGVEVNLIPGQVTYAVDDRAGQKVEPLLNVQHDLSHSTQKINEHEERIDRAFMVNIFMMIANADGEMTATEVMERANEKRLALTPILRVGEEYHKPIIRFAYMVAGRRGRLPEVPPELEGQELKIVLKSVLFQAAEMQRSTATRGSVAFVTQVGATVPSVLDNVNWDKMVREDFRRNNVPADLLLPEEEVARRRAAAAEQAAKQAQGERMNLAADTAKKLSETNTSADNALTQIMAGLQQ